MCDSQACSLFQIGCTRKREGKAKVVVVVVLLLETEKVVQEPSSSVIYRYRTIPYFIDNRLRFAVWCVKSSAKEGNV